MYGWVDNILVLDKLWQWIKEQDEQKKKKTSSEGTNDNPFFKMEAEFKFHKLTIFSCAIFIGVQSRQPQQYAPSLDFV